MNFDRRPGVLLQRPMHPLRDLRALPARPRTLQRMLVTLCVVVTWASAPAAIAADACCVDVCKQANESDPPEWAAAYDKAGTEAFQGCVIKQCGDLKAAVDRRDREQVQKIVQCMQSKKSVCEPVAERWCVKKCMSASKKTRCGPLSMVPAAVRKKMMASVNKEWPDSARMRQATMVREIEAYVAISRMKKPAKVPSKTFKAIKAYADKAWPDSYAMRKSTIETQTESYQTVATMKPPRGFSAKRFKAIKEHAKKEWPGNFRMQASTMKSEVEECQKFDATTGPSGMSKADLKALKVKAVKECGCKTPS